MDYETRGTATYAGLLSQTYASLAIAGVCIVLFESLRRIPRRRAKGPTGATADESYQTGIRKSLEANLITEQEAEALQRLKSRETWIAGYLYLGRCFCALPSPPHPKWPLQWIRQVLRFNGHHFLALAGVDAAVYLRFLQGCFYFTLLHTCTTLVIILPIHYIFSTPDLKRSNINRGSIGSISGPNSPPKAVRLLWVHMGMLFWITLTWMAVLAWFLSGVLRYRAIAARNAPAPGVARQPRAPGHTSAEANSNEKNAALSGELPPSNDPAADCTPDYSLRSRTVLVTNIPQYMRTEDEIKEYFHEFLPRVSYVRSQQIFMGRIFHGGKYTSNHGPRPPNFELHAKSPTSATMIDPTASDDLIEDIIIVRKLSGLAKLVAARERDLEELERAHIELACNVLRAVRRRLAQVRREKELQQRKEQGLGRWWDKTFIGRMIHGSTPNAADDYAAIDTLVHAMQPFLEVADRREDYYNVPKRARRWFETWILRRPPPPAPPSFETAENVWDVLLALPRELLQPYQPQTRTRHASALLLPFNALIDAVLALVRPHSRRWIERLPTIDLVFTRLTMHTDKIVKFRERDLRTIAPASSAFVTFRRWEDARRAVRGLPHHPWRPLTCICRQAPQYEDVDWRRLVKGKFTAQFLRDWIVAALIWLFQIFWLFPIQLIVTLVSVKNLTLIFPPLEDFFKDHKKIMSLVTGLLPTAIVVIIGILVPIMLYAIGRKAQTEVTWSGLHNGILIRYYKWAILNLVIFFCIGATAFNAFLQQFRRKIPDPFLVVAQSFPVTAPFYAGYFILQTSVQSAFQFALVGLPLLQYIFSVRGAGTPRKRMRCTKPRTIDYHYWTPNHLLSFHIVVIFAVLNPLVIPVALINFSCANVIFRNQFLRVYARRSYEGNGKMIAIRVLRFSMDGLGLAQIVFLAFSLLRSQPPHGPPSQSDKVRAALSGTLFGLTMIAKVAGTRWFRSRYARVEDAEFARVSGRDELFPNSSMRCGQPNPSQQEMVAESPTETASEHTHRRHSTEEIMHFRTPTDARAPVTIIPWQTSFVAAKNPFEVLRREQARTKRHQHRNSVADSMTACIVEQPDAEELKPKRIGSTDSQDVEEVNEPEPGPLAPVGSSTRRGILHPLRIAGRFLPGRRSASDHTAEPGHDYVGDAEPESAVTLHPPLKPWDDTPDNSTPYDNPYYGDLPDFLWLPRDPFSVVDLDDTVELRRVIVSTLRDDDEDEDAEGFNATQEILAAVPELASPPPAVLSPTSPSDATEMMPLSQSPRAMSVASSLSGGDSGSLSSQTGQPVLARQRSASSDYLRGGPARRPSIADVLQLQPIPSRARVPSGDRVPGTSDSQPSPRSAPLLNVVSTAYGVPWQHPQHADSISMAGTSQFSRRSSGNSGRTQSRLRPSWQTRNAIEARVREESEREDMSHRVEERNEELEDANAERGATSAVGWRTLRRLVLSSRPRD